MTKEELLELLKGLTQENGQRFERILKLAGSDDKIELSAEEFRELIEPTISLPFSRHAEFAKAMQKAEDAEKAAQQTEKEWKAWGAKAQPIMDANNAEVQRYRKRFGDLGDPAGGGDPDDKTGADDPKEPKTMSKDQFSKAEVEKMLSDHSKSFLAFNIDRDQLLQEHFERFGKIPDMKKLLAIVSESAKKGEPTDLRTAYNQEYGEMVSKHEKELDDKRIDEEVSKRLRAERDRTQKSETKGEGGVFWDQQSSENKDKNKDLTDSDRENLFAADLEAGLAAVEDTA